MTEALAWTKYRPPPAGPAVCFLPPGENGIAPSAALMTALADWLREAYAEVAARGPAPTWAQWCRSLMKSPPYAGTWRILPVPDGCSPEQALELARSDS
jgi:hypothetical protein